MTFTLSVGFCCSNLVGKVSLSTSRIQMKQESFTLLILYIPSDERETTERQTAHERVRKMSDY